MARVVIDINEETVKYIQGIQDFVCGDGLVNEMFYAIHNGQVISKGNGDLIDELCRLRSDLKSGLHVGSTLRTQAQMNKFIGALDEIIDSAPTVEPEELKRIRDICEHWNDDSSSFVSACNAFEDILHVFKMGVGDMGGDNNGKSSN